MTKMDKKADLAGPGVSTYEEVAKILPVDYKPLQQPMERMQAVFEIKRYIETAAKNSGAGGFSQPALPSGDSQ